jgi:hypothetical protein
MASIIETKISMCKSVLVASGTKPLPRKNH